MNNKRAPLHPVLLGTTTLLLALSGCDQRVAYGDVDSIILAAPSAVWTVIEEEAYTILEPTIQTVRDERTFQVTYQDPLDETWNTLRQFRQVLVMGGPEDMWVMEALEASGVDPESVDAPALLQAINVWANGQQVTIALLRNSEDSAGALNLLPEIHELLDDQFRKYVTARMFVSGADTALADTLRREAGFGLLVPNVYLWSNRDSVYRFRNDNPNPAELIREIVVTWRSGPPPEEVDENELLVWRDELVAEYYSDAQRSNPSPSEWRSFRAGPATVYQLQASWIRPPGEGVPAGGPFIARLVPCPEQERVYFIDAWLYAPGKAKYEYMLQLETILNSFECGEGRAAP